MESKEYIFIVGTSGVGKSTLARKLYEHYQSVYIEQHMIPEFYNLGETGDEKGFNEESTCFQATVALLKTFNKLGYKNVIGLDF